MRKISFILSLLVVSFILFNYAGAQGIEPRGPAPKPLAALPSIDSIKVALSPLTKQPPVATTTSNKLILVTLKDQDLKYFEGTVLVGEFKISSGLPGTPTPQGQYAVQLKKPVVDYKGPNYDFKNTKWNLLFKKNSPLNYYIHGTYWHNNFGRPMSHGCINISYANMEPLYNWADVGTKIVIE